jgi:hypothetical protein
VGRFRERRGKAAPFVYGVQPVWYGSNRTSVVAGALSVPALVLAAGAALALAGCGERKVVVHYDSEPQPVYVEQPPPAEVVVAPQEPPPLRVEVIPRAPSPAYIWVPGHYEWRRGYVWVPGHYELPPYETAVWVRAEWVRVDHGWRYEPGHWVRRGPVVVAAPPPGVIYVQQAPPAPIVEVIPAAPSAVHVWIGGFYSWHEGHYLWVKGHYEVPPHGHHEWEHDRWEKDEHGWRHQEGHWK